MCKNTHTHHLRLNAIHNSLSREFPESAADSAAVKLTFHRNGMCGVMNPPAPVNNKKEEFFKAAKTVDNAQIPAAGRAAAASRLQSMICPQRGWWFYFFALQALWLLPGRYRVMKIVSRQV